MKKKKYPAHYKNYKKKMRVICIDKNETNMYLKMGTIKKVGFNKNTSE